MIPELGRGIKETGVALEVEGATGVALELSCETCDGEISGDPVWGRGGERL